MIELMDESERLALDRAATAQAHRHDAGTLNLYPYPAEVFDYSRSAQRIEAAMLQLNEGLPCAQMARVRSGFLLLRQGVEELAVWLRSRGVDV